jgi:hypothetical protein
MSTQTVGRSHRRPALIGFVVGFAMAFVATVLALMSTFFERLLDLLVPGAALLGPLWDAMADWNGLLNMVLVGLVNGLVYAVVVTLVAAGLAAVRNRR